MVRLLLRHMGAGRGFRSPSDRCLIWINFLLFIAGVFWIFNYNTWKAKRLYSEMPLNDHGFESDEDYTMETFDFMELHRGGKAARTNIVVGSLKVTTEWCWWHSPKYPAAEDIQRTGPDWQLLYDPNKLLEMHIYNAYYDTRKGDMFPDAPAIIQVLIMVRRRLPTDTYCQFWSPDRTLISIVKSHATEIWQRPWDPRNRFYVAVLLSCPVSSSSSTQPMYISLSTQPCESATNLQKIIGYDNANSGPLSPNKHNTVVCVKGMDFLNDVSSKLVEWLEAQLMFGADKVLLYTYAVHPSISKVLKYYENTGRVQHIAITLPGDQPNIPYVRSRFIKRNRQQKRRNELVPYNDCLLRHVQTHRYALVVDIDELVVPLQYEDWPTMLQGLSQTHSIKSLSAYSIINIYKFDNLTVEFNANIPEQMWMLRHDMRSTAASPPGEFSKSFMHIPNVLTVFNHYPLHRLRRNVGKSVNVLSNIAHKLHYKSECPIEIRDTCGRYMADTTRDHSLDRFTDTLIARVNYVTKQLSLS